MAGRVRGKRTVWQRISWALSRANPHSLLYRPPRRMGGGVEAPTPTVQELQRRMARVQQCVDDLRAQLSLSKSAEWEAMKLWHSRPHQYPIIVPDRAQLLVWLMEELSLTRSRLATAEAVLREFRELYTEEEWRGIVDDIPLAVQARIDRVYTDEDVVSDDDDGVPR